MNEKLVEYKKTFRVNNTLILSDSIEKAMNIYKKNFHYGDIKYIKEEESILVDKNDR